MAVQALWRETLISFLLLLVGVVAGYVLVIHDPAWYSAFVSEDMAKGRNPLASTESLRAVLYGGGEDNFLAFFATFLFTHNAQISIFAFALGFAFGVPTALLLIYNGSTVGALLALYVVAISDCSWVAG